MKAHPLCLRDLAKCLTVTLATSVAMIASSTAGTPGVSGSISTDRSVVLANSVVTIDWEAKYPKIVTDVVDIPKPPEGTVTPKVRLRAEVRVIGAAFGPSSSPFPVRGWVKTSATGWTQIFLGNQDTYNPQTVVWSKELEAGEKLDFKFQGSHDRNYNLKSESTIRNWNTAIDTTSSSPYSWNRAVLKHGDVSPNYNPAFDQGDVHSHLAAYFEPGTTKLKLGPLDLIYLTELSPFSIGHSSTDMQDLVFLVTFTEI